MINTWGAHNIDAKEAGSNLAIDRVCPAVFCLYIHVVFSGFRERSIGIGIHVFHLGAALVFGLFGLGMSSLSAESDGSL